jgi:hypothetical protein
MINLESNQPVLFFWDIDNTVRPGIEHSADMREQGFDDMQQLGETLNAHVARRDRQQRPPLLHGPCTGRIRRSVEALARNEPAIDKSMLSSASFIISAVGGEIVEKNQSGLWTPMPGWPPSSDWPRESVNATLLEHPKLKPQEGHTDCGSKLGFFALDVEDTPEHLKAFADSIQHDLIAQDLDAEVILSGEGPKKFCDITAPGVDKGSGINHVADVFQARFGIKPIKLATGDSNNDAKAALAADCFIMPDNAEFTFQEWAQATIPDRIIWTTRPFAGGVLQGLGSLGIHL